jgi:hypothetical protein
VASADVHFAAHLRNGHVRIGLAQRKYGLCLGKLDIFYGKCYESKGQQCPICPILTTEDQYLVAMGRWDYTPNTILVLNAF